MAHRAPDGAQYWSGDEIALAHGALHATPEASLERQPVVLGERWVLVVDGRIDDREALFRELNLQPDAQGRALLGDDALFAQAWLRWGQDLWRHLVGEFALAVWDRRERRLSLLRDRVGQRPLFYVRTARRVAFASEPEALLSLDDVSRVCDQDALAYLLAASFQPGDLGATFYRDVRRVQPGEALFASGEGEFDVRRYWSMKPGDSLPCRDAHEYVDAFRETFGAAVRCRLRSPSRPALMLSGGIDSASVLGAARILGAGATSLRLISMVAGQEDDCDETPNILSMHGDADGIRLPVRRLSAHPLSQLLVEAAWERAHPIDNSLLYARLVHLSAKECGSNVVLDGADGDVVMHTDDNYAGALAVAGHPLRAWREARRASAVNTYLQGIPSWRILLHGVAAALQPAWLANARYRLHDRRHGDEALGPWIDRDFARRLRLRARKIEAAEAERRRCGDQAASLISSWWSPGITRSLEGADRTAAAFGVEARHPWCDQRVLEFVLALPQEYLARDGWTKWIARAAFAPVLSDAVAWHSGKSHLGGQVTRHVLQVSVERVTDLLERAGGRLHGVADALAIGRLLSAWRARDSSLGGADIDAVFEIATLVAWMDRFDLQPG